MATVISGIEQARDFAPGNYKIALLGFGTVGRSVARLLYARGDTHSLQLTHICNRRVSRKKVDWIAPDVAWTEHIEEVLASDADVIVELLGGLEPAHQWMRRALQSGKAVVTANKQVIARFGPELEKLARDNGQYLGYGACVAGGVPVLCGLQAGLAGDRLTQVQGILNGTCNYILTRMEHAGISFSDALAEAQQAGFAEAEPSDDVDGLDAGAKLAILARVGLNVAVLPEQVRCRSIRELRSIDFEYAHELGCAIRQISTAKVKDGKAHVAVEPSLVPKDSPLSGVSGSQNLVVSTGEFGGDTSFGGHGAGGDPTAVAVVSDLLHAAGYRFAESGPSFCPAVSCELTAEMEAPQYMRFVVRDRPGIVASLAGVLARHHLNIDALLQRPGYPKSQLPFVITLEAARQNQVEEALAEIEAFDFLVQKPFTMPILKQESVDASALYEPGLCCHVGPAR